MAKKAVPAGKKSKAAGISLPPDLIKEARKLAYAKGQSLSGFVRQLLIERLGEEAV